MTKATICASIGWAAISASFNKYVFSSWDFALVLAIFVAIDTATGVWKAWKLKTVNSHRLGGMLTKLVLYAIVLTVSHGMVNFGSENLAWAQEGIFAFLLVREGLSILENVSVIHPGILPKWVLKRLAQFQEEADENGSAAGQNTPSKPSQDA